MEVSVTRRYLHNTRVEVCDCIGVYITGRLGTEVGVCEHTNVTFIMPVKPHGNPCHQLGSPALFEVSVSIDQFDQFVELNEPFPIQ